MKTLLVAASVLLSCLIAKAQPQAGKVFAGGEIGITLQNSSDKFDGTITDESHYTSFSLLPKAGYFLSDRLAVGLQTGISASVNKFPDNNPDKSTSVSFIFRPFGRYYLISGTGGIFAEAGMGFSAGKNKVHYTGSTTEFNETSFNFNIGPGFYYFITPAISLEAQFGIMGFRSEISKSGDNKNISNEFSFRLFPSGFNLGAIFLL